MSKEGFGRRGFLQILLKKQKITIHRLNDQQLRAAIDYRTTRGDNVGVGGVSTQDNLTGSVDDPMFDEIGAQLWEDVCKWDCVVRERICAFYSEFMFLKRIYSF